MPCSLHGVNLPKRELMRVRSSRARRGQSSAVEVLTCASLMGEDGGSPRTWQIGTALADSEEGGAEEEGGVKTRRCCSSMAKRASSLTLPLSKSLRSSARHFSLVHSLSMQTARSATRCWRCAAMEAEEGAPAKAELKSVEPEECAQAACAMSNSTGENSEREMPSSRWSKSFSMDAHRERAVTRVSSELSCVQTYLRAFRAAVVTPSRSLAKL